MDVGKIAVYFLIFWLGGGLYASLMTIPFRVRGAVNQRAFNALILTWVPVFGVIALLWRPFQRLEAGRNIRVQSINYDPAGHAEVEPQEDRLEGLRATLGSMIREEEIQERRI